MTDYKKCDNYNALAYHLRNRVAKSEASLYPTDSRYAMLNIT